MRIVAISDTHGYHQQVQLPKGDLLIHAGDVSKRGLEAEIVDFLNWFQQQDFKYKVFIAGNHDFFFEKAEAQVIADLIPPGVTYLNDSGSTIEGMNIWGSPVQPWFYNWAFNRQRGEEIDQHWQKIPKNTDILITHGPPKGILDTTSRGLQVGCEKLLEKIQEVQPIYSIFGHIHEARGLVQHPHTQFINASVVNLQYQVVHDPVVLKLL